MVFERFLGGGGEEDSGLSEETQAIVEEASEKQSDREVLAHIQTKENLDVLTEEFGGEIWDRLSFFALLVLETELSVMSGCFWKFMMWDLESEEDSIDTTGASVTDVSGQPSSIQSPEIGFSPTDFSPSRIRSIDDLGVSSWEEVQAIEDKQQRVLVGTYFAYFSGMNCDMIDGNHCSGWVDSVFRAAGEAHYQSANRLYVADHYEYANDWGVRGDLDEWLPTPGDALIRWNGNDQTGRHEGIIVENRGRDSQGNYLLTTISQYQTVGKTGGDRTLREITVEPKDVKVVMRPNLV